MSDLDPKPDDVAHGADREPASSSQPSRRAGEPLGMPGADPATPTPMGDTGEGAPHGANQPARRAAAEPLDMPAGKRPPLVRFLIVAALVALDLWSKGAVFAHLQSDAVELTRDHHGHDRLLLAGEWFAFMKVLNPGMAFGLFGDQQAILVIGRLIAVAVLSVMLWRFRRIASLAGTALVLVLAGALGNLYDNLFLGNVGGWLGGEGELAFGKVRDFIDVYFGVWDWHFATFNVADACISVGAILLLLFWGKDEDEPASKTAT